MYTFACIDESAPVAMSGTRISALKKILVPGLIILKKQTDPFLDLLPLLLPLHGDLFPVRRELHRRTLVSPSLTNATEQCRQLFCSFAPPPPDSAVFVFPRRLSYISAEPHE